MRIGKAGTTLVNFGGAGWTMLGMSEDTDLHLALIEAACAYRKKDGSEAFSVALLDALAKFMGEAGIFRPITEVWESIRRVHFTVDDDALPRDDDQAGKRGIHVPANYVERQNGGWTELGTVVLSEDLTWGVVWEPHRSPHSLSAERHRKQAPDHFVYQSVSPAELVALKFSPGGGVWGITNSLLREVKLAKGRAKHRAEALQGMEQTLQMAEQIARTPADDARM